MQQKIIVNGTGGTIASLPIPEIGITPVENNEKTIEIAGYVLPFYEICKLDSTDIDDRIRNEKIGPTIARQTNEGYHPIILHGTDSIVYTAGILGYNLYGLNKRVVITGSFYIPTFHKSDAPGNKRDSVIFAMKGSKYSGVFLVLGGKVLSPFLWAKHKYIIHNPVFELLRISDVNDVFKNLESLAFQQNYHSFYRFHQPSDVIAKIKTDTISSWKDNEIISVYSDFYNVSGSIINETTYLKQDTRFHYNEGMENGVRHLDWRGSGPRTGKIPVINDIILNYGKLRNIALNDPEKKDDALADVERLLDDLGLESDIFTVYWKDSKIEFDPRTKVYSIGVPSAFSNPTPNIDAIKDGRYFGIVIRGVGFGQISINEDWKKLLQVARDYSVPVNVITKEGLITSNQYGVAKPLYEAGVNHSGTLNEDEAVIRTAVSIGHEDKRKFLLETVSELFDLNPLDILSAFYTSGLPFFNENERNEWASKHHYSTNYDIAYAQMFKWEEKILLSALNNAYVSGKIKPKNWIYS